MRILIILLHLYFANFTGVYSSALQAQTSKNRQPATLSGIAKAFLLAKERSFQQHATEKDVEAVLNFCSDTIKYDHVLSPNKKFSFSGKDDWRSGSISHLGETRNVKLEIVKCISRQNVVIIEFNLYREVKAKNGWQKSRGTTVSIIGFNKDKKIDKLTDYL